MTRKQQLDAYMRVFKTMRTWAVFYVIATLLITGYMYATEMEGWWVPLIVVVPISVVLFVTMHWYVRRTQRKLSAHD